MNILWIEDFGGGLSSGVDTLKVLFGEWVNFNAWNEDEYRPLTRPNDLTRYCSQYSLNRIHLCRHYPDYKQFRQDEEPLKGIDVVLIDIRLDNKIDLNQPVPFAEMNTARFHEEAGFYIFNDLVYRGFPSERMCFLTGETNSLNEFQQRLNALHIPKASGFEKTDTQFGKIRDWIKDKHTDYSILRRGIIEACQALRSMQDDLRFPCYQKPSKDTYTDNRSDADDNPILDLDDYLGLLERLLPICEPEAVEKSALYKIFVRTLAHEWEAVAVPGRSDDDIPKWAFAWIMKTTRNWITHDARNTFNQLTEQDVAYFFICNMRAMFSLGDDPKPYEQLLLQLFQKNPDDLVKAKQSMDNQELPLIETYVRCFNANTKTNAIYFQHIFNELQRESIKSQAQGADSLCFVTGLYQFFWLLTARLKPKPDKAKINDRNKNQIYISRHYTIEPYAYRPSTFLYEFASHIFHRSFPASSVNSN